MILVHTPHSSRLFFFPSIKLHLLLNSMNMESPSAHRLCKQLHTQPSTWGRSWTRKALDTRLIGGLGNVILWFVESLGNHKQFTKSLRHLNVVFIVSKKHSAVSMAPQGPGSQTSPRGFNSVWSRSSPWSYYTNFFHLKNSENYRVCTSEGALSVIPGPGFCSVSLVLPSKGPEKSSTCQASLHQRSKSCFFGRWVWGLQPGAHLRCKEPLQGIP